MIVQTFEASAFSRCAPDTSGTRPEARGLCNSKTMEYRTVLTAHIDQTRALFRLEFLAINRYFYKFCRHLFLRRGTLLTFFSPSAFRPRVRRFSFYASGAFCQSFRQNLAPTCSFITFTHNYLLLKYSPQPAASWSYPLAIF